MLALAVAWGSACAGPAEEPPARPPASPSDVEPPGASRDLADPDPSTQSVTVRYWAAGCSVSEDLWRWRRESKTVTCDGIGRYLPGDSGTLVWPDYIAATEIDTLTVEGEDLAPLRFELSWSADDSFSPERSIVPVEPAGPRSPTAVRFELNGSPEWQGRVRRFRLTWTGTPSHATRVIGAWGTKRVQAGK